MKTLARSVAALMVTGALLVGLAPVAAARHQPVKSCSPTGDVCVNAARVDGVRKLRIGLAAKYFNTYKLCVKAPDGTRECKRFDISQRKSGTYGDTVRWARQFPRKGPGRYTVSWRSGGSLVGRAGFHIKG